MKTVTVEVQADHLQSLARVNRPLSAISELIWNGLDADAEEVQVVFHKNDLEGLTGVAVRDNGHGLPYEEAEAAFQKLGGSWKRLAQKTRTKGRILHGQLGKGRFKAFAIGTSVIWNTVTLRTGTFLNTKSPAHLRTSARSPSPTPSKLIRVTDQLLSSTASSIEERIAAIRSFVEREIQNLSALLNDNSPS